jgi:hypothetical protein
MAHAGLWLLAGVLLGSVTGAATATFLAPQQAGVPQESASDFAARVAASMQQAVERTVERVREESAAAHPAPSPEGASTAERRVSADPGPDAPRRRPSQRESSADPAEPDAGLLVRDGSIPLPEKNAGRLELLVVRSRETEAARRREWMFVGEKTLASAFGVPDEVEQLKDGREKWCYLIPYVNAAGEQDAHHLHLTLSRGRVVAIDGAEDIRE